MVVIAHGVPADGFITPKRCANVRNDRPATISNGSWFLWKKKAKTMRRDIPGYVAPYVLRHHPVTSLLTNEKYNEFATLALRAGVKPSTHATNILLAEMAKQRAAEQ